MIKPIHSPLKGKLRVLGFASGSGNTLWRVLELQKELENTYEGSPFEVVGVFSDNPNSKALETAKTYNIPFTSLDIREYYKRFNMPLRDRTVRANYDSEVVELIKPFNADVIILAGYVWATTSAITQNYTLVNVHPADLSIQRDNVRVFAGANGVRDTLNAGESYLCSTSHIANEEIDGGPILMISPKVIVDSNLKLCENDRDKHYLRLVNQQSRLIGGHTILEIAQGNFGLDESGKVYYKGAPVPYGVRINSWDENKPLHQRLTDKLINPESVAVIGASSRGGIGHAIIDNIKSFEFPGKVYAVNKNGDDVLGVKGYSSILEIPDAIDLAIITVPSGSVIQVAEECGKKGVKVLICISAGFKEIGGYGIILEQKLMEIVNNYNMRLLGPNCMGLLNTNQEIRLNSNILKNIPKQGSVGFVTQSGALAAGIVDFAENLGLGFSIVASLGNQPDININDIMPLLAKDEQTKVILVYLESIPEPYRFLQITSKVTKEKSVIIIKSGRTQAGAAAASSHTGSLAGNDSIANALIEKSGAIRVNTLEEAFYLASALSQMPKVKGNRVGVVSNAGGPGILVADSLNDFNFELPLLPSSTREELSNHFLPEASTGNPIDLVAPAPPEHYAAAVKAMLDSRLYDALLVVCVPPATVDTGMVAKEIAKVLQKPEIPVLSCFFGPTLGKPARDVMREFGIPSFTYPEQLAQVLHLMKEKTPLNDISGSYKRPNIQSLRNIQNILSNHKSSSYLPIDHCEKVLKDYGLELAKSAFIVSPDEAESLDLNYPVVAKIDHAEIVHKSDVGGVVLNIEGPEDLKNYAKILLGKFPGARGIHVQEQLPQGLEIILGSKKDLNLGHVVMVGLGGTLVEIFKDVSLGHVPINNSIAEQMIKKLKCYPILNGYRGKDVIDLEGLKEQLLKLNQLLLDFPEIEELDLNPLIFNKKLEKFVIADCRIKLG